MNILVLCDGIPTGKYPMEGIFGFDQAKALREAGLNVVFISCDMRSFRWPRSYGYHRGKKEGIPYYSADIPLGRVPGKIRLLLGKLSVLYLYHKYLETNDKPDVVHAHFTEMAYIGAKLCSKYKIPYVVTEHSSLMNQVNISPKLKSLASYAYSNADKVIVVSSALSNNIYKQIGIKTEVVPNIIRTDVFRKCKMKEHFGFVLVTTCNLIPLKRISLLLEVMKTIVAKKNDVFLNIIGDGIERHNLENYVEINQLGKNVKFHGQLNRESISKVYEQCDCFVLPSSTETFCVAYVEAMAAGLPVIATNCGGPSDFVNDRNGLMVEVDNKKQLEEAIYYMAENYNNYKEDELKDYVTSHFSPSVIANKLIGIYNSLIINNGK